MTTVVIDNEFGQLQQVRSLYELSFPEEERLSFDALMKLAQTSDVEFVAYQDDDSGQLLGFTYTFTVERFCWGFYFAVQPALRGQGIGQLILQSLLARHNHYLFVIDIESIEQPSEQTGEAPAGLASQAMRQRRHDFYRRNGIRDTDVRRSYGGVTYQIMVHGHGSITDAEYQHLIDTMWTRIKSSDA